MNEYITLSDIELNGAVAVNTTKLIDYIKKSINVDILEDKTVTNIKRYIEKDTVEFTFHHNDNMYIATYLINLNEYEINKVV